MLFVKLFIFYIYSCFQSHNEISKHLYQELNSIWILFLYSKLKNEIVKHKNQKKITIVHRF